VGRLRIVAGRLKGRRIRVPRSPEIRPTADRVREALFSILAGAVDQAQVLDLCSGSGALGLEALSRGASAVVFVESDRSIARGLETTLDELDLSGSCRLLRADAVAVLERGSLEGQFDLILADPPYGSGLADRILRVLSRGNWLADGGRIVIERASAEPPFDETGDGLALERSARYGDTRLDFYGATARGSSDRDPGA
jgi:16S rRNA (guanine966-N2)-methyltransferase